MVNTSQELFTLMESEIGNLHISNVILQKRMAAVQEENFKLREELMKLANPQVYPDQSDPTEVPNAGEAGTKAEGNGEQARV